ILQGASAGEYTRDGDARQASALGRQAFAGVPGFIEHSFGRELLDDINNQAQNFVVYDVDAAAAEALRRHRGFAQYNAVARDLWALSRAVTVRKRRLFQRLLLDRDAALMAELSAADRATLARMQSLLA